MKESIFASLFPTTTINEAGKTISKLRTIDNKMDEDEKEEIILEHAYNSIRLTVQLNAQMIHKMLIMIKERNSNIKNYSSEIVDNSFIVPKSRKEIVKKGINYGFDFIIKHKNGYIEKINYKFFRLVWLESIQSKRIKRKLKELNQTLK